ncbi:suppressor of fused homolog [Amphiura filiformis]|uniref:suppressor of fused homolog n=1 Tax=Amphiura filiformis TaxID=82378 RepID=UPI003B224271
MNPVDAGGAGAHGPVPAPVTVVPAGLEAVYSACRRQYPDQINPLQVTAVVKYWLGGPDPLDYISMYSHPGNTEQGIPPHWHYVSYGLTDLHGDGRVHECTGAEGPSGFGFELTFRLKKEPTETAPPTWPAELMQGLARYVFQSDNILCTGDHVSWHSPLDNSESRIQHMLMADDPQLLPITTPFGFVSFIQIIGVCSEELKAAQQWNGPSVLELMKTVPMAGGTWLITDMRRGETILEINPQLQEQIDIGVATDGSNLSGVSAKCLWHDTDDQSEHGDESMSQRISEFESQQIKTALKMGLAHDHRPILPPIQSSANSIESNSRKQSLGSMSDAHGNLMDFGIPRIVDKVNVKMNVEAGALLPLAVNGRLKHGRHFTFKNYDADSAITFVSSQVEGIFVDETHPFKAKGPWLQVLIADDFMARMAGDLEELMRPKQVELPRHYHWPDKGISITVTPDD